MKPLLQAEVVDCTMVNGQALIIEMLALPSQQQTQQPGSSRLRGEQHRKRSQLLGEQSQHSGRRSRYGEGG
jgi:hypothetical protein